MPDSTKELLRTFEGPKGKADVYEVVGTEGGRVGVEQVEYEVCFGDEKHVVPSMGEAAILATNLTGGS